MPLTSAITFEQSGQGSVLIIQEIRANLAADHRCSCECTLWYVNDSLNIFNTMSRKRLRGTAAKIRRFTADFTLQVACVVLVGCQTSVDNRSHRPGESYIAADNQNKWSEDHAYPTYR
jgi:hypothetical protein